MPLRNVKPYASHTILGDLLGLRPDVWPTVPLWVTKFEDDQLHLRHCPVWMLCPMSSPFRGYAEETKKFTAWEIRRAPQGEIIGLVWRPYDAGLLRDASPVFCDQPEKIQDHGYYAFVILPDRIDITGGHQERHAISWLADLLSGRDPMTMQPLVTESREIPPHDEAALKNLAF